MDRETGRVLKATIPPNFGARGSLDAYLANLLAANELFGDDIGLAGVIDYGDGRASVLIAQPFLDGREATEPEIEEWMRARGFVPDGRHAFRDERGRRVVDARGPNILAAGGELFPIDVQILG